MVVLSAEDLTTTGAQRETGLFRTVARATQKLQPYAKYTIRTSMDTTQIRQKSRKIQKLFRRMILYVVRTDSEYVLKESAPCIDCMQVIKMMGIKRVVHTTTDGYTTIKTPATHVSTHRTEGRRFIDKRAAAIRVG